MKVTPPITPRIADASIERVRRELTDKIVDQQKLPATSLKSIQNIALADGVATPIQHGLGRKPVWSCPSPPRGPTTTGRIEEVRDGTQDRAKVIVLKATGWGATITIDLAVM